MEKVRRSKLCLSYKNKYGTLIFITLQIRRNPTNKVGVWIYTFIFYRWIEPALEVPVERSTPLSFTRPHVCAKFFSCRGWIGIVTPKQPLDGEVASIQTVPVEDISDIPVHKRLSAGPLIRLVEYSFISYFSLSGMFFQGVHRNIRISA